MIIKCELKQETYSYYIDSDYLCVVIDSVQECVQLIVLQVKKTYPEARGYAFFIGTPVFFSICRVCFLQFEGGGHIREYSIWESDFAPPAITGVERRFVG